VTTTSNTDPSRDWGQLGEQFIRDAYTKGRPFHGEYDRDHERARVAHAVDHLKWQEAGGWMALSPATFLAAIVPQLPIRVTAVAINSFVEWPDGPEMGTYPIVGIEGFNNGMRIRMYLIDTGAAGIPIAVDYNTPPAL
jgi:hypothetical protein